MAKKATRAAGETGEWRSVNRVQLGVLMGVHPDTITDYARSGMPVLRAGGRGKESAYDAVECLEWWRERQGKNAKEEAQTRLYDANAKKAVVDLKKKTGELVERQQFVREGRAFADGLRAQMRSLPKRAAQAGVITPEQVRPLDGLCREMADSISKWKTLEDAETAAEEPAA